MSRSGPAEAVPARALTPSLRPSAVLPRASARRHLGPGPPTPVGFRLLASGLPPQPLRPSLSPQASSGRLPLPGSQAGPRTPGRGCAAASGRLRAHWAPVCLIAHSRRDPVRPISPRERPYSLACADVSGALMSAVRSTSWGASRAVFGKQFALFHNKTATVLAVGLFGRAAIAVGTPIIRTSRTRLTCGGTSTDDRGTPWAAPRRPPI